MDRYRAAINVCIVLALAAAVDFLPQGGRAAATFGAILSLAFAAGIAYVAGRTYLEHRAGLYGLGDGRRALLYGAVAIGLLTITAQPRMWQSSVGEVIWFVLLGVVVYALVDSYRAARSY